MPIGFSEHPMSREAFQEEGWERAPFIDELLSVLSDDHRRFIISYLAEREEPVSIAELAREIRAWEEDPMVGTSDEGQIITSLYHRHLPKLSEADIVEIDKERTTIQSGETLADASMLLEELTQIVHVKDLGKR